ncbi:hypothetical protein B0H63DRAFT_492691 [Podospora didyma]|uniref:Monooxygenase n=1 Tax=Podospora didyma TaxID=330526 RepID=A0AAE0U3W4_9PEZI|nr:hypothetical protein B0H63DRAFT_492691 [Podospora didyma]
MAASDNTCSSRHDEFPPRGDIRSMMKREPLPFVAPGTVDTASIAGDGGPTKLAEQVLDAFNSALSADDTKTLEKLFLTGGSSPAYWKDQLALTSHLRTFTGAGVVAASLLETKKLRGVVGGGFELKGETAKFVPVTAELQFIDCRFVFKTSSPAANSKGRMLLLPAKKEGGTAKWKIWILSTWLDSLDVHPEDESLLHGPGRKLDRLDVFETDVLIIGAGNAGVTLAARLKALGVDSVMIERNSRPGDNWGNRYECMHFHLPTAFCDMPYLPYDKESLGSRLLLRHDLAEQVRRYIDTFHLNVIHSATVQSTVYDKSAKRWTVKFQTAAGSIITAVSKHLVQATGIGSQKPYIPAMKDSHLYKGISLHSKTYTNARDLVNSGVKSALVIGSANTAFDVLEDCHAAGLKTTMIVRSETYVVPYDYIQDPHGAGAYTLHGTDICDDNFMTVPTWVEASLGYKISRQFADREPDRYKNLAAAGFPVRDGAHPKAVLAHHLLERAGGHYLDVGGTKLIAERRVGVKAFVEPVGFTAGGKGVKFSDGSVLEADAVIWCTGFADKDVRDTVVEILGGGPEEANEGGKGGKNLVYPMDIKAKMEDTWGVDVEGEVRGMWKRQSRMEDVNYWIAGGHTQQHRWFSKMLALQIKAELEGILPPAYRGTPSPVGGEV